MDPRRATSIGLDVTGITINLGFRCKTTNHVAMAAKAKILTRLNNFTSGFTNPNSLWNSLSVKTTNNNRKGVYVVTNG